MSDEFSKPVRFAATALRAAIDRKWPTVERTLNRLNAECDAHGLALALVAWCDAFAEHANDGMPEFGRIRVATWNVDTGEVGPAPRESVRWASDLIGARAAGDEAAFTAQLDRLNAIRDGAERGRYVLELIESVALTIRSTPRGYARMGEQNTGGTR